MAVSDASPRTGLPRTELIGATDEQIEDAVTYADPDRAPRFALPADR